MDSAVVHALVAWSKEAQASDREALVIMVGGPDTPAARALALVGLLKRLPVFPTREAAMQALQHKADDHAPSVHSGGSPNLELATERDDAQAGVEAANGRLDEATTEQNQRAQDADPTPGT
jgi:hypothetical protein